MDLFTSISLTQVLRCTASPLRINCLKIQPNGFCFESLTKFANEHNVVPDDNTSGIEML